VQPNIATIRQSPIFSGSSEEHLKALVTHAEYLDLAAAVTICRRGDRVTHFYIVVTGAVRLFHHEGDKEITVAMLRPPATFCDIDLVRESADGTPGQVCNIDTMVPTRLIAIPRDVVMRHFDRDMYSLRMLLKDICVRRANAALRERAALYDAPIRLANFLVEYIEWAGRKVGDGVEVRPHLTWEQIANAVGIKRSSVARSMQQWKSAGILTYNKGRLTVLDKQALEDRCQGIRLTLTVTCDLTCPDELSYTATAQGC